MRRTGRWRQRDIAATPHPALRAALPPSMSEGEGDRTCGAVTIVARHDPARAASTGPGPPAVEVDVTGLPPPRGRVGRVPSAARRVGCLRARGLEVRIAATPHPALRATLPTFGGGGRDQADLRCGFASSMAAGGGDEARCAGKRAGLEFEPKEAVGIDRARQGEAVERPARSRSERRTAHRRPAGSREWPLRLRRGDARGASAPSRARGRDGAHRRRAGRAAGPCRRFRLRCPTGEPCR